MDLSSAEEVVVTQLASDRARIRWRHESVWAEFELVDNESRFVDPEDVLWWLLRGGTPLPRILDALRVAYPEFDANAEIDHTTMPDRAAAGARIKSVDKSAKEAHSRARTFQVTVEHFVDAGERDPSGQYDYYYKGDVYTFDDGVEQLQLRTYIESPTEASTLGLTCGALSRSSLADGASHYLAARGINIIRGLGPRGTL